MKRWVVIGACTLAFASIIAPAAGALPAEKKAPWAEMKFRFTKHQTDAYFGRLSEDNTINELDFTRVDDQELETAGKLFCRRLRDYKGEGARLRLKAPSTDDFSAVAEQQIANRFEGQVRDNTTLEVVPNGATVLAYGVGIAAVRSYCPRFKASLG